MSNVQTFVISNGQIWRDADLNILLDLPLLVRFWGGSNLKLLIIFAYFCLTEGKVS